MSNLAIGAKKTDDWTSEHSESENIDPALQARLRDALTKDSRLAQRWAGDITGLNDASRSSLAFSLGGMLRDTGFSFGDMCALLRINEQTGTWASEKGADGGERELERIWDRAGKRRRGESPGSAAAGDDRPVIRVLAGSLTRVVDAAEEALIDAKLGVYQRSGCIVRPAMVLVNTGEGEEKRTVTTQRILELGNYAVMESLGTAARWERLDARTGQWTAIDVPMKFVMALKDRVGQWRLPVLA